MSVDYERIFNDDTAIGTDGTFLLEYVKTPQEIFRTRMQHAMIVCTSVSSAWLQTFLAAPTMRL